MRIFLRLLLATLLLDSLGAHAQRVVANDENLESDRPEAWAMNYLAASSLMTSFGGTPELSPGRWIVAVDLGQIPRLSEAKQHVGFSGIKYEDLNKSPVFGRVRFVLGLPGSWVAELGYTPPVSINGARPRELAAIAIGRRVLERGPFTLSV